MMIMLSNSKWVIKKKVLSNFLSDLLLEKDKNFDDDDNDLMSHLNYRKLEEIKKDFFKKEEKALDLQ